MRRESCALLDRFLSCFNTASGMRSHATTYLISQHTIGCSFNTASGMRSHATRELDDLVEMGRREFQYRKRYEVTCDEDPEKDKMTKVDGFNTASGMRSHAT